MIDAGLRVILGRARTSRLVTVRGGLSAEIDPLVCRFGTSSSSVDGPLADDRSARMRNVFSFIARWHRHLGRNFLGKFAFLRLKWDITA